MSQKSTCPASPRRLASWSIPPVGAPTASFSTRRLRASRPSGPRPRPRWSSRAHTTEHTSAAEEDSPAPVGTSESTSMRSGGTSTPSSCSSHSAPRTYAAQSGTGSRPASPEGVTTTSPGACAEATDQPSAAGERVAVQPTSRANGRTNPSL